MTGYPRYTTGMFCEECNIDIVNYYEQKNKKHKPFPSIMGKATIIRPVALQMYFIKNCSNIMYHNFFFKIKLT